MSFVRDDIIVGQKPTQIKINKNILVNRFKWNISTKFAQLQVWTVSTTTNTFATSARRSKVSNPPTPYSPSQPQSSSCSPSTSVTILIQVGPCLSTFVGFLYPFLASLKSIEHNDADLIKQWLSYWIVFSFVIYFDGILSLVLFFLPLYEFFKVNYFKQSLFFIWLFNPKTNGIAII